ncbi:MAG: 2-C-methyl-D-erythritol 2,4-cyclodiphosphate synthase [Phycisphaerales bacterium]|nr:2-C-methyl-D-erythritol 2,4-cyclodiphosphate synthase [Phycisphaerales bacterium]
MSAASNPHTPPYLRSPDAQGTGLAPDQPAQPKIRIGHGYDLHRLEPLAPAGVGRPFVLAGVRIEHDRGPAGHSDADVLYHAITDGVLGSIGAPDIGQLFPNTNPAHKGQDSRFFLVEANRLLNDAGYTVVNIDATVVCEQPKIGPHKESMRNNIAEALGIGIDRINVKGKTHERVDAIGEGRAIEAHCVVLVELTDS